MNRAIIIGNLTRDPDIRTTASDKSVCTFTVAVNRRVKEKQEVDFIPVVTWEKTAESCAKFLAKGRKVGASGRIQTRSYETDSGERRYVTEIVADDVEFLTPKESRVEEEPADTGNLFGDDDIEPLDDEEELF